MQTAAALIEREEERGTERMDELLERGKANGDTLTCSELVEALEQQMMTPDAMDMLYQRLIDGNVEIVDDTEAGEMIGEEPADLEEDLDKDDAELDLETELSVPEGVAVDAHLAALTEAWCEANPVDPGTEWGRWPLSFPEMPLDEGLRDAIAAENNLLVVRANVWRVKGLAVGKRGSERQG